MVERSTSRRGGRTHGCMDEWSARKWANAADLACWPAVPAFCTLACRSHCIVIVSITLVIVTLYHERIKKCSHEKCANQESLRSRNIIIIIIFVSSHTALHYYSVSIPIVHQDTESALAKAFEADYARSSVASMLQTLHTLDDASGVTIAA
jgi:hypothetical protein